MKLRSYQREMADRIFFSLIYGDADEITIEVSRQGGKSTTLACIILTAMIVLPRLAHMFPDDETLQKFARGIRIGVFAPVDDQANTLFSRIKDIVENGAIYEFLQDPEINDEIVPGDKLIFLRKSRSFCRKQTAHAKAKVESETYHFIVLDEAQDADPETWRRRIHPMTTATAGTLVQIGTPTTHVSAYFEAIQHNKRRSLSHRKKNHFRFDWRRVAKESKLYAQSIKKEMDRLGADSDEFLMAYELTWLLDRGMFMTEEQVLELGDTRMPIIHYYDATPIVIGLDVAKKHDSTIATAVYVDWDHPNRFGLYPHRVLSWLELHGEEWESQYKQICAFARQYRVMRMGVDANGMGDPVAERLQKLLPDIEVVPLQMNPSDQGERWTHLMQLIQGKLIGWPADVNARRTKPWQRFTQQLVTVEKEYKGKYLMVGAPKNEKNSHDDYVDSLALACSLTKDFAEVTYVEQLNFNPFLETMRRH